MIDINSIIGHAAKVIRDLPEMADVPVIEVHKGSVANKLENAIGRQRFAVLVGWNGFRANGNSSKTIVGNYNLVVEVFEKPLINDDKLRLLSGAGLIANAVNLSQQPGQSPIVFREITPVVEPRPGEVSCNVIFDVSNSTL